MGLIPEVVGSIQPPWMPNVQAPAALNLKQINRIEILSNLIRAHPTLVFTGGLPHQVTVMNFSIEIHNSPDRVTRAA